MNGVALRFWSEILDVRAPVAADDRVRRSSRTRRRAVRRTQRPRPLRRST